MIKYILKKIGYMIVTLWVILTITFFLMNCIPGDPTQDSMKVLPEAVANNLKARWGLDKPVGEQYIIYLKNLLHARWESPIRLPALPQTRLFPSVFPASLQLGLQAVAVGLILGLILGILAALHRGRWIDFLTIFVAIIGVSVPSFVFAALLQKYAAGSYFPIVGWSSKGMGVGRSFNTRSCRRYRRPSAVSQPIPVSCVPLYWMY
mgnify:CR=1 FL=1